MLTKNKIENKSIFLMDGINEVLKEIKDKNIEITDVHFNTVNVTVSVKKEDTLNDVVLKIRKALGDAYSWD